MHRQQKPQRDSFVPLVFTFALLSSLLFLSAVWAYDEDIIGPLEGSDFCYTPDSDCGPSTWSGVCRTGRHQSPISLPNYAPVYPGGAQLNLNAYRANSFRMRNNGHTVQIQLVGNEDSSGKPLVGLSKIPGNLNYILDSAHFHWGPQDTVGSEHEFDGGRRFSMELHLVHYRNIYGSTENALNSNNNTDVNALAVIGILLDVPQQTSSSDNPVIGPITRNLAQVKQPSKQWTTVKESLDFTSFLPTTGQYMYTYKGSLTTPGCDEKVNWNVYSRPVSVSQEDVQKFRSLNDSHGHYMTDNERPIQPKNDRTVSLTPVTT